jgi:hypothetical protein
VTSGVTPDGKGIEPFGWLVGVPIWVTPACTGMSSMRNVDANNENNKKGIEIYFLKKLCV